MLFFGHVGISVGAVHMVDRIFHHKTDLRKVAVVAIAADLIDKPVALLWATHYGNHTRILGHSLVFSAAIFVAVLLFSRNSRTAALWWAVYAGHFVLDQVWRKDLHALFWPFLTWPAPLEKAVPLRWLDSLLWAPNIAGEVVGLLILLSLAWRYRLHDSARLRAFIGTGWLSAPGDNERS